ncbi:MAG: PspC domain-containing protein [Sphaerochaeta sp.]|jgi:phage shock protein PspC (stress-responsive transcriptional regulator)|nr:PspC domain-containing protein [Sphaerochaeta sp.]MDX9915804.1 PspC domain-containing protein [Sphaerochaeta sp.]
MYRDEEGGAQPLLLGVCSLLAHKSGLPVLLIRIIAAVLLFRFGFLAATVTYLGLAILLPRS